MEVIVWFMFLHFGPTSAAQNHLFCWTVLPITHIMEFHMRTLAHHKQSFAVQVVNYIQGRTYSVPGANIALALSHKNMCALKQNWTGYTAMPGQQLMHHAVCMCILKGSCNITSCKHP